MNFRILERKAYFSVNNQNYWNGKPYIGIGPSAHSYDGFSSRSWNVSNNHKYVAAIKKEAPLVEVEHLTTKDRYNEYVMTGLRKVEGLSLGYVKRTFGSSYVTYLAESIRKAFGGKKFLLGWGLFKNYSKSKIFIRRFSSRPI